MSRLEQWWNRVISGNPGFAQSDEILVTLSIGAIRKLTGKAHHDGFKYGMETANTLNGLGNVTSPNEDFSDLLKRFTK